VASREEGPRTSASRMSKCSFLQKTVIHGLTPVHSEVRPARERKTGRNKDSRRCRLTGDHEDLQRYGREHHHGRTTKTLVGANGFLNPVGADEKSLPNNSSAATRSRKARRNPAPVIKEIRRQFAEPARRPDRRSRVPRGSASFEDFAPDAASELGGVN